MARSFVLGIILLIAAAAGAAPREQATLVVTSSNNPAGNQLLIYDAAGVLIQTAATSGLGGVSGNAGGITATQDSVVVVNFGSSSVSVFDIVDAGVQLRQVITTLSPPVSVAFGKDHLYILGTAFVESHRITGRDVDAVADGSAALRIGDGSAAQVGVLADRLLITERSNEVEVVDLLGGVVSGPAHDVALPAGSDTPLGLATRGANGYVTIAHSDEVGLVKNGELVALTGSATQHSPCWATLVGPFLFTSNTPSHSISRYVVTGNNVVLDAPVVATTPGGPGDIASSVNIVAVLDSGAQTHLTQYAVDQDGALHQVAVSTVNKGANGVAVIGR
jgi:hypothetical protein